MVNGGDTRSATAVQRSWAQPGTPQAGPRRREDRLHRRGHMAARSATPALYPRDRKEPSVDMRTSWVCDGPVRAKRPAAKRPGDPCRRRFEPALRPMAAGRWLELQRMKTVRGPRSRSSRAAGQARPPPAPADAVAGRTPPRQVGREKKRYAAIPRCKDAMDDCADHAVLARHWA